MKATYFSLYLEFINIIVFVHSSESLFLCFVHCRAKCPSYCPNQGQVVYGFQEYEAVGISPTTSG